MSFRLVKTGDRFVTSSYLTLTNSMATPAATWYAIESTDSGGNTGWNFQDGNFATAMLAIKASDSDLNTLVGVRFYSDSMPQKVELPCACFTVISRTNSAAMTPVVVNYHTRLQVDGYAATAAGRAELRDAIVAAFYGFAGVIGGKTIKCILIDNERETIEMLDTKTQAYRVSIDFMVDWE